MKIFDLEELAALLGRSPETIKKDIRRNPHAVPPRLHIPGTRLLRWRETDVAAWLAGYVAGGGALASSDAADSASIGAPESRG